MKGEILVIPTPASMDMLRNSAQQLAKYMVKSGITVNEEISLCPDRRRLQHAVAKALDRSDIVFTIGGMGRDSGFLAKQVVSEGLGLPLENSHEALVAIRAFAARIGISSSADDVTLASLPAGSRPLIPAHGIIPGCVISSPSQHIVLLPENGEELVPMFTRQVLPFLSKAGLAAESSHEMRTYGASEEQVRQLIIDLMGTTNPVVTTRTEGGEVVVKVLATAKTSTEAGNLSSPILRSIATRLGDYAYGLDVTNLESSLFQKMSRKNLTLGVAEAGTSGKIASRIARIDPKHQVIIAGELADTPESKLSLGMKKKQVKSKASVSEATAVALADAVRQSSGADIGLGITANLPNYAKGDDSIVYIAVCDSRYVYIKKIMVEDDSISNIEGIIDAAVSRSINMTRLFVDYHPEPYAGSVPLKQALSGKVSVTDKDSYGDIADYTEEGPEFFHDQQEEKPKKTGRARKIILIIAVLAVVLGGLRLGLYFYQSYAARGLRDNLSEAYDLYGFDGLRGLNPDTVAFVSLEGTEMRYPIVQSEDNNYYLRRDFNKKGNDHGIPFLDYRGDPRKPSDNLVVYGHNMRDGQIFGELLKYKDIEYYKANPIIQFDTLKKKGDYKVFAIFITSAEPNHFDSGNVFKYNEFVDFGSDSDFNAYINQIKVRSLLNLPVDVQPGDELITLSTCDYDFSDSRFVVMARRVRSGESNDIDLASASTNPTPLYPDVWYTTYGGTRPDLDSLNLEPLSVASVNNIEAEVETPKPEPAKETPTPEPEKTTDDSAKAAEEKKKAEDAAAQKAAEDKKKTDDAAAQKAAEEKKKTDDTAAQKAAEEKKKTDDAAAAKKAEEDKKKAEEAAAKKAEDDKKKAEADKTAGAEKEAVALAKEAEDAATAAASHQASALGARSKEDAEGYAEKARAAATKAETAAAKARTAANLSESNTALSAADEAEQSAARARQSADTAGANASAISEERYDGAVETPKTATPASSPATTTDGSSGSSNSGNLKVSSSTSYTKGNDLEIISKIVQQEIGSGYHAEALKAQAVAAYSYIANSNSRGVVPAVYMSTKVDSKVENAVKEVIGQAVIYNGKPAYTTYYATSPGVTTSSKSVWGGHYPYLISVDSSVDSSARGYTVTKKMSADEVADKISQKLGIEASGDPESWFEIMSYEDGVYVGNVTVCGYAKSQKTGSVLTGRLVRETVFNLRSAAFEIDYDYSSDTFIFTTYGFGHGVGMSQTGANAYAKQGMSYSEILAHYYPGTSVG